MLRAVGVRVDPVEGLRVVRADADGLDALLRGELPAGAEQHIAVVARIVGPAQRPRLAVFRSNNHMYAQIIDDTVGNTLVSASTLDKDIKAELEKTNNVDAAAKLGTVIAKKALDKGISTVVFDRGGFIYAGKVKALAEAAREAGLDF